MRPWILGLHECMMNMCMPDVSYDTYTVIQKKGATITMAITLSILD